MRSIPGTCHRVRCAPFVIALALVALPCLVFGNATDPNRPSPAWIEKVARRIAQEEYHVTWQDCAPGGPGWQAANRAQGLRVYFRPEGPEVGARSAQKGDDWCWRFRTQAWGRQSAMSPVAQARLRPRENRIDYVRGALIERYENRPDGLEQFFIVRERPSGSGPLQIAARMHAERLRATARDNGAVGFRLGDREVVSYGALKAFDAQGRALPASSSFSEGMLSIVIDDADAAYPITVDPLVKGPTPASSSGLYGISATPDWTKEGAQFEEWYGYSIGTAGDVNADGYSDIFIASPYDSTVGRWAGRVDVFYGSATGPSTTPDWTAYGETGYYEYGRCASTAGDVNGDGYSDLIVGAYYYGEGDEEAEGKVYVYLGSQGGLETTAAWTAESNQYYAEFGERVSTAGDVNGDGYSDVLVCARYYENTISDEGAAFIWYGSASGLGDPGTPANADWAVYGGVAGAYLARVATGGDLNNDGYSDVVVALPDYDHPSDSGLSNMGQVRVYFGSSSGLDTTADWLATGNERACNLGEAISAAGDFNGDGYADLLATAPGYDAADGVDGAAFVWFGGSGGLGDPGTPANADFALLHPTNSSFGDFAFTAGDVNGDGYADIMVGAHRHDGALTDQGAAYAWYGCASPPDVSYTAVAPWHASGENEKDYYGIRVATAGDVNGDGFSDVMVNAGRYSGITTETGKVYLYFGGADGLSTQSQWSELGAQTNAYLGLAARSAGDVNGDGYGDVIVGAPGYDGGLENEGRANLYFGTGMGLGLTPVWYGEGEQEGAWYGVSVDTAGDVNGDGYSDIAIGAWYYDDTYNNSGGVFVYHGGFSGPGATGTPANADFSATGNQLNAYLGCSVSHGGDIDGDGYGDLIVGAFGHDNGETLSDTGKAIVLYGSSSGLAGGASWSSVPAVANTWFGYSVACAGDLNNDGYSDIIVGAPRTDTSVADGGGAFVFYGSASGIDIAHPGSMWAAGGAVANQWLGYSVGGEIDFNGDGYSDIVVGAPSLSGDGRVFMWYGSASGMGDTGSPANADETVVGPAASGFGASVCGAGDLNGDGYGDFAAGGPYFDDSGDKIGVVFVAYGGLPSSPGVTGASQWLYGPQADARFGICVATAGDVNGDGFSDLLVGADYYDDANSKDGAAYMYYGGGRRGVSITPRQTTVAGDSPIAHLNQPPARFHATLRSHSPFGRTRVMGDFDCEPCDGWFDNTIPYAEYNWCDTGPCGIDVQAVLWGQGIGRHHWRARLRYDPVSSPYLQRSRWYSIPRGGWTQADLALGYGQVGWSPGQAINVNTDGHFYFAAYNFVHNTWDRSYDGYASGGIQCPLPHDEWLGLYVYDYGEADWLEGIYVYKSALE